MTICISCGREEFNGKCGYCTQKAKEKAQRRYDVETGKYMSESYAQTAAKVRRELGDREYDIFMREYEIFKEAKKEGREAMEGYIANRLYELSNMLHLKTRKIPIF